MHLSLRGEGCFQFEAHAPPHAPTRPILTRTSFQRPPEWVGYRHNNLIAVPTERKAAIHDRSRRLVVRHAVARRMPARMRTLSTHAVRMARLLFVMSCQFTHLVLPDDPGM